MQTKTTESITVPMSVNYVSTILQVKIKLMQFSTTVIYWGLD